MNPFRYRATIDRLARLAERPNPAHVRVSAAGALVKELSPINPRRELVHRLLDFANPFEHARHKLRDLYEQTPLASEGTLCPPLPPGEGWAEGPLPTEDDLPAENDDPL